jgi:pimeloyl-ACP methyl ester carboxylesterase
LKGYDKDYAKRLPGWWPLDWVQTQSFNPMDIITQTTIPVLSIYGANDTQVDPQQGAKAYRESLEAAGNPFFTVKILPNTDHNMF